ncbi:MAG TPA: hypothetical protein VER04_15345 [Polyangiaceae bacterium]|nr:hypothetical protein [Polyangiaceae bacterium]
MPRKLPLLARPNVHFSRSTAHASAIGAGLLLCLFTPRALHAEPEAASGAHGQERYRTPIPGSEAYWHGFGSLSLGKGLRFNNPYRLATPLGDSAESLSLTAAYYDLGLGFVRGPARGLAHGAVLHWSIAAQGIPQQVLSVSYTVLDRLDNGRVLLLGRAGIPITLEPDLSAGVELGASAAYMISAGLGVQGELVGSLYYGAATQDRSVTTIPVLSAQLGLFIDYEVLP